MVIAQGVDNVENIHARNFKLTADININLITIYYILITKYIPNIWRSIRCEYLLRTK